MLISGSHPRCFPAHGDAPAQSRHHRASRPCGLFEQALAFDERGAVVSAMEFDICDFVGFTTKYRGQDIAVL